MKAIKDNYGFIVTLIALLVIDVTLLTKCTSKMQLGIVKECTYDNKNHIYHIKLNCVKNHKEYGIHSRNFRHVGDSLYFKKP